MVAPTKIIADRENGIIRNVVLQQPISRNGTLYTPEAMRKLPALYERKTVKIGHWKQPATNGVGVIVNAKLNESGDQIRGDWKIPKSHSFYDTIMDYAEDEDMHGVLALSHEIKSGQSIQEHRGGFKRVIDVKSVAGFSVELEGGVNSGLAERLSHTMYQNTTELRSAHPHLVTQIESQYASALAEECGCSGGDLKATVEKQRATIESLEAKIGEMERAGEVRDNRAAMQESLIAAGADAATLNDPAIAESLDALAQLPKAAAEKACAAQLKLMRMNGISESNNQSQRPASTAAPELQESFSARSGGFSNVDIPSFAPRDFLG